MVRLSQRPPSRNRATHFAGTCRGRSRFSQVLLASWSSTRPTKWWKYSCKDGFCSTPICRGFQRKEDWYKISTVSCLENSFFLYCIAFQEKISLDTDNNTTHIPDWHPRFALIQLLCPEMSQADQERLLEKHVGTKKSLDKEWTKAYMHDVLQKLAEEDDFREFEDLKLQADEALRQEFILSRVGSSKAKASFWTPKCVKDLRPIGTTLVWQQAMKAYQAYYPIPQDVRDVAAEKAKASKSSTRKRRVQTHWSRSRTYGERRSQLDALKWCVKWLWQTYKKQGGEPYPFAIASVFNLFRPWFWLTVSNWYTIPSLSEVYVHSLIPSLLVFHHVPTSV